MSKINQKEIDKKKTVRLMWQVGQHASDFKKKYHLQDIVADNICSGRLGERKKKRVWPGEQMVQNST